MVILNTHVALLIIFPFLCTLLSVVIIMKEKNLKRVGENIRAARKSKNLTIETLSELAGISESFLGTVERGESSISIETLINLCKVLGVSADSLIMHDEEPAPALSDKRDTLLTMLKNATDKELDFLIDYVKLYRGRVKFKADHQ